MGYLKRPVRRGVARRQKRSHFDVARHIDPAGWTDAAALDRVAADAYLRFAVRRADGTMCGLFRSCTLIDPSDDVPDSAASAARAAFRWFNRNLAVPPRLPRTAVCWFRADASECVAQIRTLVEVYRLAGHPVWMIATRSPGRVVYRDELQAAAVPRRYARATANVW